MSPIVAKAPSIAVDAVRDLVGRLGIDAPPESLPGADLVAAAEQGRDLPEPGRLLRAVDGWFHPGPPTVWADFAAMATSLGAPPGCTGDELPDVSSLTIDALDAEAAAWLLPATAVRPAPAAAPLIPEIDGSGVAGARVALLGVLAHAIKADKSTTGVEVKVLSHEELDEDVAAVTLGAEPTREQNLADLLEREPKMSFDDWRIEVMGLVNGEF